MLQQFIQWLPTEVGAVSLVIAIVGALVGAVLWLAGARFSRALVGLVTVSIGGAMGMMMPRYFGWDVSGSGPAVGMALLLGFSGYIMHRFWVGVGLGTVLAAWAFLTTWVLLKAPNTLAWPQIQPDSTLASYASDLWHALPPDVAGVLPYACGAAMLTGLIVTIFWPRLAVATAWSAAGVSLLAGMGSAAMEFGRPQWVQSIPRQPGSQGAALLVLVAIGAAAQWKTARFATARKILVPVRKGSAASKSVSDGAN